MAWLRERGYDGVVGDWRDGERHVSASKDARAAELTTMLADPSIRAVVPPWGGVTSIDLLDRIGWDELAGADPTDAVRLQLILLYVLVGAASIAALVSTTLARRNFFTPAHQLREPPPP